MDDRELWDAFSSSALPESQWIHREHLRIAWMFLERHSIDEAHLLMRVGIIRLNAFHGLVETPARAFVDAHAAQLGRDAVMSHYSRERLLSVHARAIFVEPDLAPLP